MNTSKKLVAVAVSLFCGAASAVPTTLQTLTLGQDTAAITVDPVTRKAYVTNYTSGTLSIVDVDTLSSKDVSIGPRPRRAVVNAASGMLYLVNDTTPGHLTVFDTSAEKIMAQIDTGNRSRGIAADFQAGEVYVSNRDGNSVSIVDTKTNTVIATVAVGLAPGGLDVNTRLGKIYVTSGIDNTVSVIDQRSHALDKTIAVGRNPGFAAVDERTGKVFVNNINDNTMSVIDSVKGEVVDTVKVGRGSTFATVSAVYHRAYLPNAADNTLSIIDTDTDNVVKTVRVGLSPQDAVVDAGDGNVYVVNQGNNSVSVIDARSEDEITAFAVGRAPWRMVSGLGRLLVLNTNGSGADSMTVTTQQDTLAGTAIATEYYNAKLDHYFHTSSGPETRVLADGAFGDDWNRTLEFFRVWTEPGTMRTPVCRLFSASFGDKSSHVFTPYATECDALKSNGVWQYEGIAYYVAVPDGAGNCPESTVPLYRLYNQGQGGAPNHRYTASTATAAVMVGKGWVLEGNGPQSVFACTPTLRGD